MTPYILLIIIPFLFQFIALDKKSRRKIHIGKSQYVKENNLAIPVFFMVLTLLLILRDETVGRDLKNYKHIFIDFSDSTFETIINTKHEKIFALFNWGIGQITDSYQIYIAIIAILTLMPICYLYCENRQYAYIKIILFVNMSTFIMLFSGIRQAWAIGVGVVAYQMVRKKAFWRYILICILAMGIHTSAFMLLFMYPLFHMTFKKKHLLFVIPMITIVFVFNRRIFTVLGIILSSFTEYEISISNTGAYGTLLLFLAFLLFGYTAVEETEMDKEAIGLRNFLILAVLIQCFVPLHSLAMRMGYYYIIFIPLAVSKTLQFRKNQYAQVSQIAEIAICIFFTVVFIWSTYQSYVTGISTLDTVPYVPFWIN